MISVLLCYLAHLLLNILNVKNARYIISFIEELYKIKIYH